jgi:two-component system LytT family response regulator
MDAPCLLRKSIQHPALVKANVSMINAHIIDDEPDARVLLRALLKSHCPEIHLAGETGGVQESIEYLREHRPDLLFLDVHLRDGSGFEILDYFAPFAFRVIFITAHDTFALRAFRYHAAHYLLKPVLAADLTDAVARALHPAAVQPALFGSLRGSFLTRNLDKIVVNSTTSITVLPLADILRLEGEGNYTTFFMADGEKITASKGIKEFEDMLPESGFCRVHQSHILQICHVRKFLKEDGGYALLRNGDRIPVARRKRDLFLEMLVRSFILFLPLWCYLPN